MTAAAREPLLGDVTPIVIILRKTQGSVWREAGRTELCPTLDWLRERFGHGEYELQLKLGNRIVCMVNALARQSAEVPAPASVGTVLPGGVLPGGATRSDNVRGDGVRGDYGRRGGDRPRYGQRRFA
jgi:hypothetical protein